MAQEDFPSNGVNANRLIFSWSALPLAPMVLTHDNLKGTKFFLGLLFLPQAVWIYEWTIMTGLSFFFLVEGSGGGGGVLWSKDFNSTPHSRYNLKIHPL